MKASEGGYWVRIAFLFLIRSGRSTAALSIMVATAVAGLIFLSALSVGVEDAMLRNTVGLFSGHITGYDLPDSMAAQDLMVDGVDAVLRRSYLSGTVSKTGSSQPIVACGIDAGTEADRTALSRKFLKGRYPISGRREILISRNTAQAIGADTGDTLRFTNQRKSRVLELAVSGIYQTGLETLDHGIAFTTLDLAPFKNAPWSAAVFLKTGVEPDFVMQQYRRKFPDPVRFETWEDQMPDLRQLIDLEKVSMVIVILLVFGVVAIGIACSFVIFIIRNMREYGILKAMGVTTAEMSALIVSKVVLMNLLACGAGLLIGAIAAVSVSQMGGIDIGAFTSHNRYFAVSGVIQPRLTTFSLWAPPAIAMTFSLAAGFWPAAMVARQKVAVILRMV